MKYLLVANLAAAQAVSHAAAVLAGCGDGTDVTQYWYSFRRHPTLTTAVVEVQDDDGGKYLTDAQRAALVATIDASWTPAIGLP